MVELRGETIRTDNIGYLLAGAPPGSAPGEGHGDPWPGKPPRLTRGVADGYGGVRRARARRRARGAIRERGPSRSLAMREGAGG